MILSKSMEADNDANRTMEDFENENSEGGETVGSGGSLTPAADSQDDANTQTVGQDYLLIEEVIFLYEQGKLEVSFDETDGSNNDSSTTVTSMSTSYRLYSLLEPCGVSLPAYLVYAHLRSQNFRVLRHTTTRRKILDKIKEALELLQVSRDSQSEVGVDEDVDDKSQGKLSGNFGDTSKSNGETNAELTPVTNRVLNELILQLREDAANARPPTIYQKLDATERMDSSLVSSDAVVAFDVYKPNTNFSRRLPGLPDYYVAATFYNAARCSPQLATPPSLTFDQLQDLLRSADGIPLRLATVSDAGTVVMFGVTDFGVPEIQRP